MLMRRIRNFLDLRLQDVEAASGVPGYRLAKAERGTIRLNSAEAAALEAYYRARLRVVLADAHEQELEAQN